MYQNINKLFNLWNFIKFISMNWKWIFNSIFIIIRLEYAIKEIDKRNLKANDMVGQLKNEVKIMYKLNHPNILKIYNHFEDDRSIYLVLELAKGVKKC